MRFTLVIFLLAAGCAPCEPDFKTPIGIPVCLHGGVESDRATIGIYLDTVFLKVRKGFPGYQLHRLHVEIYAYPKDGKGGTFFYDNWVQEDYIRLEWVEPPTYGYAYAHELFHQLGFDHGDDEIWYNKDLRGLDVYYSLKGAEAVEAP